MRKFNLGLCLLISFTFKRSMLKKRLIIWVSAMFFLMTAIPTINTQAQVTLTASSGTASGSFTTLKGAFDAINAGTHTGTIVISINASTTETISAELNASGSGSASYTSINIYPTATGLSISGTLAAPLINLVGADNVTIDGRVNATGSTKSLTITNNSTSNLTNVGTSTIRFINDASSNTVKYCTLKGSSRNASSGGIIFFSTSTGTTGNDDNTITNNDITCAADANRPCNALYALGTPGKINNNNTISNNNFYNFLNRSIASQGINISNYNSAFTISGNSFYETATFTATAAVNYNIILISSTSADGCTVSDNYIGGSAAFCAGTAWTKTAQNNAFTSISLYNVSGANNIQGNTIQNFNWTNAGTSDFTGISIAGTTQANIGTTTGNTIGATTGNSSITFTSTTTATDFYAISIASTSNDSVKCENNNIGSITVANASTNATNFYGIFKSASANTTITNNTIGSTTTASSINASSVSTSNDQLVYGIYSSGDAGGGGSYILGNTIANLVNSTTNTSYITYGYINGIRVESGGNSIYSNTVYNLSIANANPFIDDLSAVSGIVMLSTDAGQTISNNKVYNLSNSNSSFAGGVIGIYYRGFDASEVSKNFVHSLSVTGASSTSAMLFGIKINSGTTTYSNNIISLGGNTTTNIYGIYQDADIIDDISLYFNTVNISGSLASGATNTSYALYSTGNGSNLNFRNNVLVNARSTTSGASKHYALSAFSGPNLTCDYNNYYVSGTGGVLGKDGTDVATLPLVTSQDANSIATNPSFVSTGTTASGYLPTVEGAGVIGTGITVDYYGNLRGSSVNMGALICSNPTSGGTIADSQIGSSGFNPVAFTSSAAASGQVGTPGTLEYKWQSSTTSSSAGFSDIASSNSATYDANTLTQTTWFKRLARVDCKSDWAGAAESNVLQICITPSTPLVDVVNNCNGTSTLSTTASGSLLWSTNETTTSITVTSAGTYTVTQTANGCTSASGSGVAAPKTAPTAGINNITGSTELTCNRSSINVTATGGVSYAWSGGLGSSDAATISSAGTYTVTVTGANSCTSTAAISIVSIPSPNATISASGATTFTYGNSVVLSGPPFVLPSVVESVGNALSLNGTSDYVSIPSGINNNFSGNQITVEGWFYPTTQLFNNTALIGEAYEGDGVIKFVLSSEFESGVQKIKAGFFSDAYGWVQGTSSVNLSYNQWTHIAATYDQANIKIYVNGSLTCTYANTNALPNGSESWFLGKKWDEAEYCFFPGTMDEVRIWNVARTQAQIQFSMNNRISTTTSGLVGYYKLDESSGTTATDATGHGYDGTVN